MRIYQRALLPLTNLLGLHRASAEATSGGAPFGSIDNIQQPILSMSAANATKRAPAISISHGGGPRTLPIVSSKPWLTATSTHPR